MFHYPLFFSFCQNCMVLNSYYSQPFHLFKIPFSVDSFILICFLFFFQFSCGFALICERDENRLVAENILNLIIRNLQEYCQIILQPSEVNKS